MEPLLKFDEMYHRDHVTAYKMKNSKTSSSVPKPDRAINVNKSYPLPSKKFRVKNVTENLKGHFTKCWKLEKSKSSKLSFYNTIKNKFARESYLDTVKGFNTNMINNHHKAILNGHIRQNMGTDESKSSVQRHSFILNCVSTFMYRAIAKRQKFMSDLKVREVNANTIIINF